MAIDELTPMVADEAGNLIEGDHLGDVVKVNHARTGDYVLIELHGQNTTRILSIWPEPTYGKTYRSDVMVVRWAREHEIDHDHDHNIEHGGEG